jgi:hypothetical protein
LTPVRVAIMQPYFFPYLGYFELVALADVLVLYTDVQYIRHGWVNRNRIRCRPAEESWQYIRVPVRRAPLSTLIDAMRISYDEPWMTKIEHAAATAYGGAATSDVLLAGLRTRVAEHPDLLVDLLEATLRDTCAALGIETKMMRSSALGTAELHGQERILRLCAQLGADEYLNLPGGRELYDAAAFERAGIRLSFVGALSHPTPEDANYLSVLDLSLDGGLDAAASYLRDRRPEPA